VRGEPGAMKLHILHGHAAALPAQIASRVLCCEKAPYRGVKATQGPQIAGPPPGEAPGYCAHFSLGHCLRLHAY
jgi:hypothetical protein